MVRHLLALLCFAPALAWGVEAARPVNPDTTSVSTALGALNAACTLSTSGQMSAGFQLAAGTLIGTIVPEVSYDNGTTWVGTFFDDPTAVAPSAASIVFASSNTATSRSLHGAGGARQFRVRVSAFTSGTANCTIVASQVTDPSTLYEAADGTAAPPSTVQVGGKDGSGNVQAFNVDAAGNLSANLGLVGGTAIVNGGVAGTQGVGGVSATNTAITQNPMLIAAEAQSGQPAAATTARQRQVISTLDGVLFHRGGGPVSTSFNVISTATTIQVINTSLAGASLSYYIDDIDLFASTISTTTADQALEIKQCTTAACAGTCTVVVACTNPAFGGCSHSYQNPIKLTANTCLCWMNAVTGTKWITVTYHVAP